MCGRFRLSRRKQLIEEYFDCVVEDDDWSPRYNIAPMQSIPVIRKKPEEPRRRLSLIRWGLVPSWSHDSSGAAAMINARLETVDTKPTFRDAIKFRRCLVPADGFYEWGASGKLKQPYCFEVGEGELFAFAGIWERWKDPAEKGPANWIETCAILTAPANPVASAIHDRMPVILDPDQYDVWLDPRVTDLQAATEILKSHNADRLRFYPVSTRVNQVANDDQECAAFVEPAQERLF